MARDILRGRLTARINKEAFKMGLRFRRNVRIAPGVALNLSKSDVSLSLGKPGLAINLNSAGHKTTVGLPGSGLSYQTSRTQWDRQQLARFTRVAVWFAAASITIAILLVFQR
jgi:hypothetical protein